MEDPPADPDLMQKFPDHSLATKFIPLFPPGVAATN